MMFWAYPILGGKEYVSTLYLSFFPLFIIQNSFECIWADFLFDAFLIRIISLRLRLV